MYLLHFNHEVPSAPKELRRSSVDFFDIFFNFLLSTFLSSNFSLPLLKKLIFNILKIIFKTIFSLIKYLFLLYFLIFLMFAKKPREKQKEVKLPLIYYKIHDIPYLNLNSLEWIHCVGFDPGMVNPSIRMESRNQWTGEIKPIFTIKFDLYELFEVEVDEQYKTDNAPYTFFKLLNNIKNYLICANIIIMEKQLPINYKAVCISKYFIAWCHSNLANNAAATILVEMAPVTKYLELGCPKEYNENAKKKWGIEKALELSQMRLDHETYNLIVKAPKSKRDDMADAILMIETFFKLCKMRLTEDWRGRIGEGIERVEKVESRGKGKKEISSFSIQGNTGQKIAIYGNFNM